MVTKICNILRTIIIVILIVIVAILLIPKIFGYSSLAVVSGSMEPEYPVGSIVVTKEIEFSEIEVGDVITYKLSDSTLVTHRVVEIDKENQTLITKGDANETNDISPVSSSQIYGKVYSDIPYMGYISVYMKTKLGIAAICGVIIAIIILSVIPELLKKDDDEEKEDTDKISDETHKQEK